MQTLQPHLRIKKGDIAPYVFLPGDPGRIRKIIKYWEIAKKIAYNREFLTYTGRYRGIPVSATSTGIGAPSAAIAVEELANAGAKVFIRIGTCGALIKNIQQGDLVIPSQALRLEGTTQEYSKRGRLILPDQLIFHLLVKSAKYLSAAYFTGVNRTHDAFYESVKNFLDLTKLKEFRQNKLVSSEMECSAVFAVAKWRGLKAGAILAVNTVEPLKEIAKNPDLIYRLATSPKAKQGVEKAIEVALNAIELLKK